jgi:hypothetical protein
MRNLRGLVVDDQSENARVIQSRLAFELRRLGYTSEWIVETDEMVARQAVRAGDSFDFAVVDLFLNAKHIQSGLALIRDIHEKDSRTFRLIITSHGDWSPGFRAEAQLYGAYAIDRNELLESRRWSFGNLAVLIRDHVLSVGLVEIGAMRYDASDAALVSLIQRVGDSVTREVRLKNSSERRREAGVRVIRDLAIRCLGDIYNPYSTLQLRYLATSRFGSQVCRLDVENPGEADQAFVFKFGLDKRMLELEVMANSEAREVLGEQTLAPNIGDVQSDSSGYHGIAARAMQGAITLAQWLRDEAKPEDAKRVAEVILGELLVPLFQEHLRARVSLQEWISPSAVEVVRANAIIDVYLPALADRRAGDRERVASEMYQLRSFLAGKAFVQDYWISTPGYVIYVGSLGDLNSRTVLVSPHSHQHPVLIDASLYGSRHWAADIARLIVDLFLRIRRPGVDSMVWDSLKEATEVGLRLCPASHGGAGKSLSATDAFISCAIAGLRGFTQSTALGVADEWHWQWHVALGKEFLRQASHHDLTPPLAAQSLLLAAAHLRTGRLLLKRSTRSAGAGEASI